MSASTSKSAFARRVKDNKTRVDAASDPSPATREVASSSVAVPSQVAESDSRPGANSTNGASNGNGAAARPDIRATLTPGGPSDQDALLLGTFPLADGGNGSGGQPAAGSPLAQMRYASAGDHGAVYHLLTAVFQSPTRDAFSATLDDPFYEPTDRVLIKCGHRLLGHIQVSKRSMHFGPLVLPSAGVYWLATLPEYRGRGFAQALLQAAHDLMVEDGSLLGYLKTQVPHFFRRNGWALCGRHAWSTVGTRDVLAHLGTRSGGRQLSVRPWRQVELPGVMRVYKQNTHDSYGAVERTEAYWRWLVSRKGFDNLFVAIEGPDRFELEETHARIVGYAVTKQHHIIELFADPDVPQATAHLLRRACGEAIERDHHAVAYHGPPADAVHELFAAAGGESQWSETYGGEVSMVRVFDPAGLLRKLAPALHRRAVAAKLARPCELALEFEGEKLQLVATRRGVRIVPDKTCRNRVILSRVDLTRLLLGHLDVSAADQDGRLRCANRTAYKIANTLFPPVPLWRSQLDELLV